MAPDSLDALRYRRLRDLHWASAPMCVVTNPKKNVMLGSFCPSGKQLDDLVDGLSD